MTSRWVRPTRLTGWAMAIALLTSAWTAAYLMILYPSLPYGVPVRFENGAALLFQRKTPLVVALPAVMQLGLLTVFGVLIMVLLWRARPLPASVGEPADPDSTRMRLAAEGIALFGAVWTAVQALGAVRLVAVYRGAAPDYGWAYTFAIVTAIVASIVVGARTMKLVGDQRRPAPAVDPALWRCTHLYFNAGDPALFVPTRTGAGWTLNFGRPLAIMLLAGTLVLGIGAPYVFARYVLRAFTFE